MSSTNSPTLIIDVRPQPLQRLALPVLCAGACIPLLVTTLGPAQTALAVAACAVVLGIGLRRAGWLGGRRRLVSLCWHCDGRWLLTDARNHTVECVLRADSRVGARYVWLRWANRHGPWLARHSLLLTSGDMPPAQWRRLIVRLHIDAARGPDTAGAVAL